MSTATATKAVGDLPKAMVALFPDSANAALIALDQDQELINQGVEILTPEDLHVTLAYFPAVSDVNALIQCAALCAANCYESISTEVEGVAQFTPKPGDPTPYVLLMDPTRLVGLARMLQNSPDAASNHGFIPHMTLAYVPDGVNLSVTLPPEIPLQFSALSLVVGDNRYDFAFHPLGVDSPVAMMSIKSDLFDSVKNTVETANQPHSVVSQTTGEGVTYTESTKTVSKTLAKEASERLSERLSDQESSEKAGKRIGSSMLTRIGDAMSTLKDVLSWGKYEDQEANDDESNDESMTMMKLLEDPKPGSFVVFKDATTGQDRWVSFSSNAFRDRDGEVISTKALEAQVTYGDATGDRGTLRLYHIPGTDIGDCDFQGVQGRFLIESGTFRDTELAEKAKQYFANAEEPLGISVGFRYPETAFDGRVHTSIKIFERSVLPERGAANPWTTFLTLKEESMDPKKVGFLNAIAGSSLATQLLATAETASKALEAEVAFKALADEDPLAASFITLKGIIADGSDDKLKSAFGAFEALTVEGLKAKTPDEKKAAEDAADGGADDDEENADGSKKNPFAKKEAPDANSEAATVLAAVKELLSPLADGLAKTNSDVAALAEQLKASQEAQAEKSSNAPRGASVFRASDADANIISDAAKVQEALAIKEAPSNPAAPYIADLIGTAGRVN